MKTKARRVRKVRPESQKAVPELEKSDLKAKKRFKGMKTKVYRVQKVIPESRKEASRYENEA